MKRVTAASASVRNCGTFDTGTEISCLIEPPSGFCDSEINSRNAHSSARWLSDWAMAASLTKPFSIAASSNASMLPSAGSAISASTYHGEAERQRIARAHMADGELQRQVGDELEGHDAIAAHLLGQRQEIDRRLRIGHRDEGRLIGLAAWDRASSPRR